MTFHCPETMILEEWESRDVGLETPPPAKNWPTHILVLWWHHPYETATPSCLYKFWSSIKPQSPGENSHKMIIREGLWGGVKESEQKNKKPLKMSLTHSNAGSLTWGQGLNPDPHRDNVRSLTHWATVGTPIDDVLSTHKSRIFASLLNWVLLWNA